MKKCKLMCILILSIQIVSAQIKIHKKASPLVSHSQYWLFSQRAVKDSIKCILIGRDHRMSFDSTSTFDTIAVVMLVCDTTVPAIEPFKYNELILVSKVEANVPLNAISWCEGYLIFSPSEGTYYLDKDKIRLGKNILVWMTKKKIN